MGNKIRTIIWLEIDWEELPTDRCLVLTKSGYISLGLFGYDYRTEEVYFIGSDRNIVGDELDDITHYILEKDLV